MPLYLLKTPKFTNRIQALAAELVEELKEVEYTDRDPKNNIQTLGQVQGRYNCLGKTLLPIHHERNTPHPTPVKIGNTVVKPTETAKLMGVMLDHKLIFRNHVELAQRRGTKAVPALTRISSPTFGLPHAYTRQLFQSIVVQGWSARCRCGTAR
jgi:hypothetical protein